ncbi:hypothetical protein BCV69DRAFT_149353 [Microstroma glucosiphilum]|uniref:Uncharacterized protein n=1 Tax=Pseudomicrostroma glucosiphilum TaxID=1684307 RepID=A0A316UBG1_9BASI|nr:hypothetical protein BCV69DRAFT_149353 [Pseudomicrostroma glucosiphilum]PWN22570.1 hypothetical protein BCV69DRAFT_149353 [Pseudomicrostroma glucosiphilum]
MRDWDVTGDLSALDQRLEQMHTSGHPSLRVEESFATRVLMSLRHCKVEGESGYVSDARRVDTIKSAYNAVLRLDTKGMLDFNFPALVEKAILTLAQRESGTDAARIYHFVVHETDDTSGSTKLARWFAYFLLRQMQAARFLKGCTLKSDSAPDWTKANSDRTEDDVLGVLLLPAIVDDTSVLVYAKAHGLVSDWPQFLARVARCLLLDPLKGKLLKAISKWCKVAGLSHFPAVLAQAVESHGASLLSNLGFPTYRDCSELHPAPLPH